MAKKGDVLFCHICGEDLFILKSDIKNNEMIIPEKFKAISPMEITGYGERVICPHCGNDVAFKEECIKSN